MHTFRSQESGTDDSQLDDAIDSSEPPAREGHVERKSGNPAYKRIHLKSMDNPYVVPFLMNCKKDHPMSISSAVPLRIQENATFVVNLESLDARKDLYADDNGAWKMNGVKTKWFAILRDNGGRVTQLDKTSRASADVAVKRRTYTCSSHASYHKTIVSIEFGNDIEKWFPLVLLNYHFEDKPTSFKVLTHGNRKSSNLPHIRTKESTKINVAAKAEHFGPKRTLFEARKDAGGICGATSTSSLPRNMDQVKYLKRKPEERRSKDPLASVLELQKTTFPGFIREVVCNDLPTVMLFRDRQMNNIVKFCCHKKANRVSELGVDVTFQLGPFYLLVTSFRNTMLWVKSSGNHPSFLGPVMACMTKEESTYLSFIHCLNREIPGLSEFLHATGTDDERALRNALAAGFRGATPLLCYIHSKRNIEAKCRKLGLSTALVSRICKDLYREKSGLVWSSSRDEFDARARVLMSEWETLERSEKAGPMFAEYFRAHKLNDMRNRMAAYVMKELGLGNKPYEQNVPESVNSMIKDWNQFVAQDLDRFIVSLYDFAQSFDQEEELAWFGLSDKWEVCEEFTQHFPAKSYAEMTQGERKAHLQKVEKLCPDPVAHRRCCSFKFSPISRTSTVAPPSQCDISDLSALSSQFSMEEQASLLEKAKAILLNETYRKGFQDRVYFVDSGGALPYRVQCCNNGNCSCGCSFFSRNNFCHHCLAIAIHLSCVPKVTEAYKGRSLTKVSTATAPRNVGGKMPSRKRKLPEASPSNQPDAVAEGCNFHSEVVNPTTVVIRKQARPVDPPSSAPWVLKIISGGIRKCAGCRNAIRTNIVGYQTAEDQMYCFGRFEAYHFWNKTTNCWQLASSTRHYHINPVCTQAGSQQLFTIRIGSVNLTESLRLLIVERFGCNPE